MLYEIKLDSRGAWGSNNKALKFKVEQPKKTASNYEWEIPTRESDVSQTFLSLLGTTVYDLLTLRWSEQDNDLYVFRDHPVMNAKQAKRIVEQMPVGIDKNNRAKGSLKEKVATEDVAITIKGVLVHETHEHTPFDAIEGFYKMFAQDNVLIAESKYLQALQVTHLVIKSMTIEALEDFPDTHIYTLECASDTPFNLELD